MRMSEQKNEWRPNASLQALQQRDVLLRAIRRYFAESNSLEVQTPALSAAATTDPHIQSFSLEQTADCLWLHTSPEFPMKRLISAYAIDIHQFATVFRQEEAGRNHNREFVLLEWYRMRASIDELVADAVQVLSVACEALQTSALPLQRVCYQDVVKHGCGAYPHELTAADIAAVFADHKRSFPTSLFDDDPNSARDNALTLFIDEFVVADFDPCCITALANFPASQASLATTSQHSAGHTIADRVELYIGSTEIANGFHELTVASEQRQRFEQDNHARVQAGNKAVPIDNHLLAALQHGMPKCAGMALGIDRLLMVLGGYNSLQDVIAFTAERA